jgi:hypothetical protein
MKSETLAKAYVLTHGVTFSSTAIRHAQEVGAKGQNLVYNAPAAIDSEFRPQELLFVGDDGYSVCVSAVARVPGRQAAEIDLVDGVLSITTPGIEIPNLDEICISYVPEPSYYKSTTTTGRPLTRVVSACGTDELNVWPWHDCAIGRTCTFCGINKVQGLVGWETDPIHSLKWRAEPSVATSWAAMKEQTIEEVVEAVRVACDDPCYDEHLHLIMISGNLANHQLDDQARIYADIAQALRRHFSHRFTDGIIAVTAPPLDFSLLELMKDSGIDTIVLNLEAYTPEAFQRHCPGKASIGRDHYIHALERSVEVFGRGHSWCNFVLGLEATSALLDGCERLAELGISPGANVLHVDHGASIDLHAPSYGDVIGFYGRLAEICRRHDHRPYYCSKALRTSLANEAFDGRLING